MDGHALLLRRRTEFFGNRSIGAGAGRTCSAFTTTANLQLVVASDGSLEGVWSDCAISGNELDDGTDGSVSCHFWHESDYFKPNDFEISADGETLSILEKPGIDSEAQKCQGDLSKQ